MRNLFACAALAAAVSVAAAPALAETRMSIATGSSGGVYYLWGGALAKLWSENIADTRFNVEATTGQVPNVKLDTSKNPCIPSPLMIH